MCSRNQILIELELNLVRSHVRADEKKQSDQPSHDPIAFLYKSMGMCFLIVR